MSISVLGIDIAKATFALAALREGKLRHRSFDNTPSGFTQLLAWLDKQGIEKPLVAMEATGIYYEALATFLHEHGLTVFVVNPAQIKHFADAKLVRGKTDRADAAVIARFLHAHFADLQRWHPLPAAQRLLRDLTRRLTALQDLLHQESNRLESAGDDIVRLSIEAVMKALNEQIKAIEARIRQHIDDDPDLRREAALLHSIPAVGTKTSTLFIAEFRLARFKNAREAAAFAGLSPAQYESGSSVRGRTRISKTGASRLRAALYFPAIVAAHHNPILMAFYQRLLASGLAKKAAICAVMRKLIHIAFGILKSGKPFNPQFLQNEFKNA